MLATEKGRQNSRPPIKTRSHQIHPGALSEYAVHVLSAPRRTACMARCADCAAPVFVQDADIAYAIHNPLFLVFY